MTVRPTLGSLPNARSFRGQPLVIMLAVLALWIGLRVSFWSVPIDASVVSVPIARTGGTDPATIAGGRNEQHGSLAAAWAISTANLASSGEKQSTASPFPAAAVRWLEATGETRPGLVDRGFHSSGIPHASSSALASEARTLAWRPEQTSPDTATFSLLARPARANELRRFSVDGWLFLREGGGPDAGAGPLAPTYGKSQFGAVLRYDLGSRTAHLPQAYLRATGAIDSREADLAAGFSIRPLPALPLRAHGEVRLSRLGERVELRPSAFVTAGIEETLPLDARVRGYAQAGYVGGEFATAFAYGSLVVESVAKRFEHGALALGLGAWGGAQEGTERLDAGPTASMDLRVGGGTVRLAADYRFRVAGDAKPSSGAALTLSSSF